MAKQPPSTARTPTRISAKKSLGQHFLHDRHVLERIAGAANLSKTQGVLEIGPGTGALTRYLAKAAGRLVAVETDGRVMPLLQAEFAKSPHVTLLHADAMTLDWAGLQRDYFDGQPFALCANLPYYITSPLIMAALEGGAEVDPIVVLVQREVAERMAAKPGQAGYGLLSLAAQRYAAVEVCFGVAPGCFTPPPKVMSAVVRLRRKPDAPTREQSRAFFTLARAAFAMRRKTLENNLISGLSLPREVVAQTLLGLGIDPKTRAEQLGEQAFLHMAQAFEGKMAQSTGNNPEITGTGTRTDHRKGDQT